MKTIAVSRHRETRSLDQTRAKLPVTDYAYQSLAVDGFRGRCAPAFEPSFRTISDNYFSREAKHSFAGEAAFFVAIIVTAAWPIAQNLHALSDFVRAISGV